MSEKDEISGSLTLFANNSFKRLVQWHYPYAKLLYDSKFYGPLLDIGCGRGSFLDACKSVKADWDLTGLEMDRTLAADVRALGHRVLVGDASQVLEELPEEVNFEIIHLSHIIEHMQPHELLRLLTNSIRALRKGGVLIVRTPNWSHPAVSGGGFWHDFSHVRPYPLESFEPVLASLGIQPWLVGSEPYGWEDIFYFGIKQSVPVKKALLVGGVRVIHSLGKINGQLIRKLATERFMPKVMPTEPFVYPADDLVMAVASNPDNRYFGDPDLWIGHSWPAVSPPLIGERHLYLPWEYYAPLVEWKGKVISCTEVWTCSEYAARGFREYDLHPNVRVVYPRVDPVIYGAVGEKLVFPEAEGLTRFLFVGGTIWRKGIDVLLQAYRQAFSRSDPVVLIIKDMGNNSFYKGQTAEPILAQYLSDPNAPRIIHSTESFTESQMANLYRGADVLVHPYRAEGFGMPILEAMACGIPVVVSDGGPSDEFVTDGTYIKCPTTIMTGNDKVDAMPTVGPIRWLEPEKDSLVEILRICLANKALLKHEARLRAFNVGKTWGWDHVSLFPEGQ